MRIVFQKQIDYPMEAVGALQAVYRARHPKGGEDDFQAHLADIAKEHASDAAFAAQRLNAAYRDVESSLTLKDEALEAYFAIPEGQQTSLGRACLVIRGHLDGRPASGVMLMTAILAALCDPELSAPPDGSMEGFIVLIEQNLSTPSGRWCALDLYRRYEAHLAQVLELIAPVEAVLKKHADALEAVVDYYYSDSLISVLDERLSEMGVKMDQSAYCVVPALFCYNSLTMENGALFEKYFGIRTRTVLYLGALCLPIMQMLKTGEAEEEDILRRLRALNDKTRLKMLNALKDGPKYTKELIALTGVTAATLSHHTSELLSARLITLQKEGTSLLYGLSQSDIKRFLTLLESHLLK